MLTDLHGNQHATCKNVCKDFLQHPASSLPCLEKAKEASFRQLLRVSNLEVTKDAAEL